MKKKIGILGGISHTSTIKYYQTLMNLYYERFGNYYYPEIIMHSLDFQYFTDLENELKLQEYMDYIDIRLMELYWAVLNYHCS
ncbi:hypothetical protein HMPREF0322_03781 [Desulfitobacterium hafniense DP7]|uniref:Uncharacterized protein n=2 Tax=Desulfitobacterium hafniense TaxID=49338 RepID=A0A0W1JFT5_DESHA|nr:hypothetical protein [Desulfitobacterium hafniense]EHL05561.1 hypothetical protein HMPREF0322_03781 [Desulfitobacterium hafniense DP7]KTE90620.1 hypothetical protein AT727_08505 [Desulfitobacterium hafniense]